jgi:hypothetical protein
VTEEMLRLLSAAQQGLRARFEDFRRAFDRRDETAYRMAIADFHERLRRWTEAEERALLPALRRAELPARDPQRELAVEYVQLRELTRHVRLQVEGGASMADLLGFVENLSRRLDAHEHEKFNVYYPAAAPLLTQDERQTLEDSAPPP